MYVCIRIDVCIYMCKYMEHPRTLFQRGAVKRVAGTKPLLHARHTNRYIHTLIH